MVNIPTDNNNPGDIKDVTGHFKTMANPLTGQAALYNDLTAKMTGQSKTGLNGNSSLVDFAKVYDGSTNQRDNLQYAANLANKLGVSPDTKIGTLLPHIDQFARAVADNEGYKGEWSGSMDTKISQSSSYNPKPFSSPTGTPGAVDLTPTANPNVPQVSDLKGTTKDVAEKGGKGLLHALGNFGTGVVKGTGQILDAPAKALANPINNAIFGKKQTDYGNALADKSYQPKGNAQKVGAFVGRDVLPATGATLATLGAGSEATGISIPETLGKIGQLIGKTYRGAKVVGKVAAGTALAAEAIKNPKQVFGLIGKLIDGLSHFGE